MNEYKVGGVYWDAELEVPYTVTDRTWDVPFQMWRVRRADLDYPCYGRSERGFWFDPETDARDAELHTPADLIWF